MMDVAAGQSFEDSAASAKRGSILDTAIADVDASLTATRTLLFPEAEAFNALINEKALERRNAYGPRETIPPLDDLRTFAENELHLRYLSGALESVPVAEAKVAALRRSYEAVEREAFAAPRPSLHPGGEHARDRQLVETYAVRVLLEQQVAQADLEGLTPEELVSELERAEAANDRARAYVADRLARRAVASYVPAPESLASLTKDAAVVRLRKLETERDAWLARIQTVSVGRLTALERVRLSTAKDKLRAAEKELADLRELAKVARRSNRVAVSASRPAPAPVA